MIKEFEDKDLIENDLKELNNNFDEPLLDKLDKDIQHTEKQSAEQPKCPITFRDKSEIKYYT